MNGASKVTMNDPIVKTVYCTGSPYKIGFTHGSSVSAEVHHNVDMYTYFFGETAKITWQQARERAVTRFLPTIERQWPEIIDEMRGIAEGAGGGLTLEDIVTLNVRTEIAFTNYTDGCTSLGQSGGGKMFLAQNWDMIPELQEGMVLLHIKPQGSEIALRFLGEAGIVGKIGMNSAGFGLCMNALRSAALNPSNMPVHVMSRRLLQYATSYDAAVAIIREFGLASSINYVLADKSGKFADIECSPVGTFLIRPENGFVAHSNHFYGLGRPSTLKDHPAADSLTRLARIRELSEDDIRHQVDTTFKTLRSRLSDEQGSPPAICRSVPPGAKGIDRIITLGTILMELTSCTGQATIGRPCEDLPIVDWSF
ncbi:acyl-coenzyme A:6-aminopenicillanic acid acyl-transferase-domain-containing protein [Exophiala viscosa]|uniref:Acyl-coenzyme A:6-aminopenicillanic acid acyl-transferase-domain-containing protein n=1 Tax=Exophiala viscosa TaxID=2486360 RepID=A0AAN6IH42_9EURO|nr:acyl-coenzyme A:6-aminopenicillanic acid acyl-transferase-domain-containing protein [Exophiala viscosa]